MHDDICSATLTFIPARSPAHPRAVVTGAAGFIGSSLAEALAADGYEVVAVDALASRPYSAAPKRATFAALARVAGVRTVVADLRTDAVHDLVRGADVVVHAAALAGLRHTAADPHAAWAHNVEATRRIVEAAAASGSRFVLASTSSVYGAHAVGDENQPQRPVSVYGRTKQAAEQVVLSAAAAGRVDAVIVRYFSVYGRRQRADMAYALFIESLLDDAPLTVHGDGHQRRSITHVDDAVSGTLAALRNGRNGVAYNIGGGTSISVLEAVELIGDALGTRPVLRFAPAPRGDQRITRADTTRAAQELGWVPAVSPTDGIAEQVAWHWERRHVAARGPAQLGAALVSSGHS